MLCIAGDFTDDGTDEQFFEYIRAVDKFKEPFFDVVLIDGRARVACAMYIIKFLRPSSIVIIHDYDARRNYHVVVSHYDVIARVHEGQSTAVLRPKKDKLPTNSV